MELLKLGWRSEPSKYNDEKAQEVKDTVNELYDQERELIRQKLDNVIDYYHDIDSYLSSITSKVESLINLNERMGKRSSLTDLIKQFSDMSAQLSNITESTSEFKKDVTEINFGESESVNEAIAKDKQEQIAALEEQIKNLTLSNETSGTYKKLSEKIAKKEAEIDKYQKNGWDETRSKKYDKLLAELDNLYDLESELNAYATSDTIVNYKKLYTELQKLDNKIKNGQELKPKQQKNMILYGNN